MGNQEASKINLPPVFHEVFCNHAYILAPSTVPGKEPKNDMRAKLFIQTPKKVWSYLRQAFEVKAAQEALQKLKRRKLQIQFDGASGGCRLTRSYMHKKT